MLLIPVVNFHQYQRHQRQICHQCQRHWWQIMGTMSGCRHRKMNLMAKIYIYVNSTTQRCPNKIINLPPMSTTPVVVHLELRISPWIFEKKSKPPLWYTQGLGGNWFMKKTRSRKSRGTVPLSWNSPYSIGRSMVCNSHRPWNTPCRVRNCGSEVVPAYMYSKIHIRKTSGHLLHNGSKT